MPTVPELCQAVRNRQRGTAPWDADMAGLADAVELVYDVSQAASGAHTISTGSKVFAVAAQPRIAPGADVMVAMASAPANRMAGVVTATTASTITVNVSYAEGSGSASDWTIQRAGVPGLMPTVPVDLNATTTALSGTLTLTWAGAQVQYVTSTTDAAKILLPPESGFPADKGLFRVIVNRGARPIAIRNNSDTSTLAHAMPGRSITMAIADQAGTPRWEIIDQTENAALRLWLQPLFLEQTANSNAGGVSVYPLTATRFLVMHTTTLATPSFIAVEVVAGVPRVGPQLDVTFGGNSVTANGNIAVRPWNTDQAFVALVTTSSAGANDTLYCRTLSINWTTLVITANTAATLSAATVNALGCDARLMDGANVFCVTYEFPVSSAQRPRAVMVTAGVSTTIHTPADIIASTQNIETPYLLRMSATLGLYVARNDTATSTIVANRLVISGTTVTPGTQVTVDATTSNTLCGVWGHSATTATAFYYRAGVLYSRLITDTGAALTVGAENIVVTGGANSQGTWQLRALNAVSAFLLRYDNSRLIHMQRLQQAAGVITMPTAAILPPPGLERTAFVDIGGDWLRSEAVGNIIGMAGLVPFIASNGNAIAFAAYFGDTP